MFSDSCVRSRCRPGEPAPLRELRRPRGALQERDRPLSLSLMVASRQLTCTGA